MVLAGILLLAGAAGLALLLRMNTPPPPAAPPPATPQAVSVPPTAAAAVTILAPDGTPRLRLSAELAEDERSRELGLMYRQSLARTHGMLFLFDVQDTLSFWMRNTRIPLDMIFADSTGRIVTIHANTEPYSLSGYASTEPALMVLETAAGVAAESGVKPGDRITWERTPVAGRRP